MARIIDLENAMDISTLYDWYITSVSQDDEPVWTEKHIDELFKDFYVIPKETPTIEPVKQFVNELIYRLNNHANRYVGGTCNGRFYPEAELFEVDEVYEIIDRVLDGTPEDTGARMDGN